MVIVCSVIVVVVFSVVEMCVVYWRLSVLLSVVVFVCSGVCL